MKRYAAYGIMGLLFLVLAAPAVNAQDADAIIEKMLDAQGGRKLLDSIKDSTSRAEMEIPIYGISGTGIMYVKEPNKSRLDMEFQGMMMTQASDGETAWTINPQTGAAEELPAELAEIMKDSAYGNAAFLHPEKYGITYEFKGKESIDGREYLVLERIMPSGYPISYYIDAETYLLYKVKQQSYDEMMSEITEEAFMSDYKAVDGVMTAHAITISRDGTEYVILTITEVTFNTGLEDSFFSMGK